MIVVMNWWNGEIFDDHVIVFFSAQKLGEFIWEQIAQCFETPNKASTYHSLGSWNH